MSDDSREATKAFLVFILVMLACLIVGRLFAEDAVAVTPNRYQIDDIRVKDGDTIQADIHLGFGVVLNDETIRASDYDAWETSRRRKTLDITDAELTKGQLAKTFLAELFAERAVLIEQNKKDNRDVYGRILSSWYVLENGEWSSVSVIMKAAGHQRSNERGSDTQVQPEKAPLGI